MKAIEAATNARELFGAGRWAAVRRYIFWFNDDLRNVGDDAEEIRIMTEQEPPLTGFALFDAAVAALAERHCVNVGLPIPEWTQAPSRYIAPASLGPSGTEGAHKVHPTLLAHGVILLEDGLVTKQEAAKRVADEEAKLSGACRA